MMSQPNPMAPPQAPAAPGAGKLTITPQSLLAKMKLAPGEAQMLKRMEVAGMKIMFSPQTRQLLQQALAGQGPIAQKVGLGIAGLLGLLVKEAHNSVPRQLLIPCGMLLVVHAAEFLDKASMVMTDADVGAAIQVMVHAVLGAGKIDSNKIAQIGASGKMPPPRGAPQGRPQGPPQGQPMAPQPAGGM